jgi:HlyD family secretion protein
MNTDIFRKVALARLASPEQLDEILRVTTPKSWLALAAMLLLLGVAVVWGYEGSIATKATGQGVIVRTGNVSNIVTPSGGLIMSMDVKIGQIIKPGEVVAHVAQPALAERIRTTKEQMADFQRLRERAVLLRQDGAKLQTEAIDRQKSNLEREITEHQELQRITAEQIPVDEQLLEKGLIVKQQVLERKQRLVTIGANIESLRAQIKQLDAQRFEAANSPLQSDAEMASRIADLARTLAGLEKELSLTTNVVSPWGGEIIELKADNGSIVPAGTPLFSIQPDVKSLDMLVYLPASKAKDAKPGMDVQISPSTVKREEFGFMMGKVTFVADYPATSAALMRNFNNESLVKSLAADGPVTELRVTLMPDPSTPSGFKWSSSRGPEIIISSGTICTVQIVTREQKPITLLFPFIKEKLGLS